MSNEATQRLRACQRCRSRKTRCDHVLPSCHSCTKAGVACMSDDKTLGKNLTRSEAWALEQRIRNISESFQSGENPTNAASLTNFTEETEESRPKKRRVEVSAIESDDLDSETSENENQFSGFNTFLGSAISEHGSSHVSEDIRGEIRRYSHSFTPQGARETFIATENLSIAKLGRDFLRALRRNVVKNQATDVTAYDMPILKRVSRRYFTWINSAYPVMHEKQFFEMLETCHSGSNETSKLVLFQVKIVIAIALASISRPHLSTSELGHSSHAFWKSATKLLSASIGEALGLLQLQISLLLLQYTLLVPKSGNVWQLVGSAVRCSTELGLYAEPTPGKMVDPLTLDLRRRLFWTCYCVDRTLSTIMGRPSSIPDEWISAEMPSLVEDSLICSDGIHSGPTCHLKVALIHHVHICRLQLEIHSRLYAPGHTSKVDQESLTKWTWHTYDQLRAWRLSHVYPTPLITKEWTDFQFHVAVVLLLRPSPNRAKPTFEELHVAFHSAGQAMKLVKIMHREASAVFAWLTVQSLFMCGLTYIKYLRVFCNGNEAHLCKPFVEIILEVQACTSMLETLSALDTGDHEQIRNVFELASSNVLHDLSNSVGFSSRPSTNEECVWDQLARNQTGSVQRPINIQGSPIEIQSDQNQNIISRLQERDHSLVDDEHFYQHDVDANSTSGYSHSRPYESSMTGDSQGAIATKTWRNRESSADSLSAEDVPRDAPFFNRGYPSYPSPGIFTTPIQESLPDMPNIPDNTSADLERWFLYPI